MSNLKEMREAADEAVRRGMKWLDANVPNWREKVDVDSLDLQAPCGCVLGQIDGDFYEAVWKRRLERQEVLDRGFTASPGITFRTLTAAWRRALKQGVEAS